MESNTNFHDTTLVYFLQNPKRSESQALLSSCLDGASGFYLTLLQEVCTVFDLDLPFRRRDLTHGMCRRSTALTKPHRNSCYYICQHCLVHLGDIARYSNHSRQAEAFYRSVQSIIKIQKLACDLCFRISNLILKDWILRIHNFL